MYQPLLITKLQLLNKARKAGCCTPYQMRILRARNKEQLIDIFVDGLKFCLAKDYPGEEYILQHFGKHELHLHGIYVNECITRQTTHKALVALGSCYGRLLYDDWKQHRVAVNGTGKVNIIAKDHTFVMVDIYDSATVTIAAHDKSSIVVYYYGEANKPNIVQQGEQTKVKIQHREILKDPQL